MDLESILGRVNSVLAGKFADYFVGPEQGLRYDSPKVPEAILRLRLLGSGLPLFRLDHDVMFQGDNKDSDDLGLFKAIACSLHAYHLRLTNPSVSTFLFSASYNTDTLLNENSDLGDFDHWSRAFATRIHPALVANPAEVIKICNSLVNRKRKTRIARWDDYAKLNLDQLMARNFYGLKTAAGHLEPDHMNGLTSVGAHPLFSVISGALLCLSDGAILDLPPFSNFTNNVMWIDDHLKYSLHRAIHHFTSGEALDLGSGLSDARLSDVKVTKGRPAIDDLPVYVCGGYLPTLLLGAIMDAWITCDDIRILKLRHRNLSSERQEDWKAAWKRKDEPPLPSAILKALGAGSFDNAPRKELRENLEASAVERINLVRNLWVDLRDDKKEIRTFASYWASGEVESAFGLECFANAKDSTWQGISKKNGDITSFDDLLDGIKSKIVKLCDDAVTYVEWTLKWPGVVQIIRSIAQGKFRGDLSWPS